MSRSSTLLASLQETWYRILDALPDLGLAALLLIVGWLLARLARRYSVRALRALKVDALAERLGFEDFLIQGGVKLTTVTLLANTLYWVILAGVFVALLDALGIEAAGDLISMAVRALPHLVLAIGILVFGSLLARVIGRLVASYLSNVESPAAEPVGAIARYAVLVFAVFMAAEQLAIRTEILVSAFQIAFAAVCLAGAIAFGLGGKTWAESVLSRLLKR